MKLGLDFLLAYFGVKKVQYFIFNFLLQTTFGQFYSIHNPGCLRQIPGILAVLTAETNISGLEFDCPGNRFKRVYKGNFLSLLQDFSVVEVSEDFKEVLVVFEFRQNMFNLLVLEVKDFVDVVGNTFERLIFLFFSFVLVIFIDLILVVGEVNLDFFVGLFHHFLASVFEFLF